MSLKMVAVVAIALLLYVSGVVFLIVIQLTDSVRVSHLLVTVCSSILWRNTQDHV